ncbi:MAG TPA: SusD/RagB family nutrient-binding outer membrane lipoprotein, partial [Sediminibacterium sp.]|nr:SusD/RagB family nutrient-binding outer membrane lipoprotein [Sediminibacterium sp.]
MKKILLYISSLMVLSSCSKSFLDVNNSPNSATFSRSDYAMAGALNTTAQNLNGPNAIGSAWTGYYGFSTSFTGGGQQKTYVFTNTDFTYWDSYYHNIYDYQYVIQNGDKEGYSYLVGPAMIMQANLFQSLVDMYGNVPYSQALKLQSYVTPSYDDAQAIYIDLVKKLDTAITKIKAATWPSPAPGDIMFSGNKTNWVKLANTLKLRILMRQAYVTSQASYITTELNKIVTEGSGFLTSNAFINPGYVKQTGKLNPFYSSFGYNENDVEQTNHRFYKMGDVILNFLKNTHDIFRLQRVADVKVSNPIPDPVTGLPDKNNPDNYVGIPLGARGNAYLETLVSSIGSCQVNKGDATRPIVFMSAAESYFLQAEAAYRSGILALGDPQLLYQNGITQSFILDAATHTGTATATAAAATTAATT